MDYKKNPNKQEDNLRTGFPFERKLLILKAIEDEQIFLTQKLFL